MNDVTSVIDMSQISLERLVKELLPYNWQRECVIIGEYMPPYPRAGDKPTCVISHPKSGLFLRYSKGPETGTGWDVYGDDFQFEELALMALSNAQPPTSFKVRP